MLLQPLLEFLVPYVVHVLELFGIVIIAAAAIKSFFSYAAGSKNISKNKNKLQFAEAVALALEFKLASEIIKTVTIRSMKELYILGAVILLRVIMTFVIQWEIKNDSSQKERGGQNGSSTQTDSKPKQSSKS